MPKEMDLLYDLPLPPYCAKRERHKLNNYKINSIHSDPLLEFIHPEICLFLDMGTLNYLNIFS